MVDPVEVKLDEIEDHVLKTQADVDRLMRDFSKPEKGKEILGQLPGGGGFIEQIVKGISGKGGIMSAGMAGGMAAGGIMALVQIIGDAIANSKILMTVLGTIGKALGLLIDVILLPFLPILTTGIIWLYQGIMLFYKLWNGIWTSKTMQTIGSALTVLGGILAKGISSFFNVQFGLIGAGADLIWKVLTWLWGIITGGGIITASLAFILGPFGVLLDWLYDIATGKTTIKATVDFLLGGAGDLLKWLYNFTTSGLKIALDFTSNIASVLGLGSVSSSLGAVSSAVSDPLGWLKGLLHFDQGGMVPGTGPQLAVVHGGETITPAGQGGSTHFHFYGYDDNKLMKRISDILRQQQYRYQA